MFNCFWSTIYLLFLVFRNLTAHTGFIKWTLPSTLYLSLFKIDHHYTRHDLRIQLFSKEADRTKELLVAFHEKGNPFSIYLYRIIKCICSCFACVGRMCTQVYHIWWKYLSIVLRNSCNQYGAATSHALNGKAKLYTVLTR